ncbi:MAG TPA: hypothetical protein PKK56_02795 [archaeon]|nr:hypothetical protein [archaeon]
MGKAVSNITKRKAEVIISEFKEELSTDFEKNKKFLKDMKLPLSKLTINLMAGYITRAMKKEIKEKEAIHIEKETDIPIQKPKQTVISH